jgi:sec-independent protein translocase protein TatB
MLSIPHLVVIFLIALIVLGPEKLPQVARVLGKAMADFRRITTDFRVQIEDEMREMERHTRLQQTNPSTPSPAFTPPYTPSDAELLGATLTPTATPAEAPPPATTPAPATVPEKPADGDPHPA